MGFPRQEYGVGYHSLLQGIFLTWLVPGQVPPGIGGTAGLPLYAFPGGAVVRIFLLMQEMWETQV